MTFSVIHEFADYGITAATIVLCLFSIPMLAGFPEKVKESLDKIILFEKKL